MKISDIHCAVYWLLSSSSTEVHFCPVLVLNNSSILAHVSGGRQQHSAFPALCVPARLGLGLGFYSHLELRAQECHCSSLQTMAGSDTHMQTHKMHINRHMQGELIPACASPPKLRSPLFVMLLLLTCIQSETSGFLLEYSGQTLESELYALCGFRFVNPH